jgi:hypothetical protein
MLLVGPLRRTLACCAPVEFRPGNLEHPEWNSTNPIWYGFGRSAHNRSHFERSTDQEKGRLGLAIPHGFLFELIRVANASLNLKFLRENAELQKKLYNTVYGKNRLNPRHL